MPSRTATATTTTTTTTHTTSSSSTAAPSSRYSLPLKGRAASPPLPPAVATPSASSSSSHSPSLIKTPLAFSGRLATRLDQVQAKRTQLTPAIGTRFGRGLQLREVLELEDEVERDNILRDVAIEISLNGVCFFEDQELSASELASLALHLGRVSGKPDDSTLHIHPTQELGENGELPVGSISSEPDEKGRQISFMDSDKSRLASSGWHTDVSFEPRPACYSLLRMHTLPECGGDTLFSSSYATYDMLSPRMKTLVESLTATHHAEMFREQSRRHGFQLRTEPRGAPENSGDSFIATHPVVRTNPVTGLKALFVNKSFTSRLLPLSLDESEVLLNYLIKLNSESHDAQVRFRWNTNDLAIWDNRSTQHVATFDYGTEKRQGDRVVVCGEKPYLDPESKGRKEWEREEKEEEMKKRVQVKQSF